MSGGGRELHKQCKCIIAMAQKNWKSSDSMARKTGMSYFITSQSSLHLDFNFDTSCEPISSQPPVNPSKALDFFSSGEPRKGTELNKLQRTLGPLHFLQLTEPGLGVLGFSQTWAALGLPCRRSETKAHKIELRWRTLPSLAYY